MIYNSVAKIIEAINETRDELMRKISALTEEEKNSRADEKGWSVTEIIEHLATVENGMLKISGKLLAQAEKEGKTFDGAFNSPISFVEASDAMRTQKFEAPERVRPTRKQGVAESLEKMKENRRLLQEMRSRLESVDALQPTFPHPFLGPLNAYQWLAMIGIHEQRHLQQIEKILAEKI